MKLAVFSRFPGRSFAVALLLLAAPKLAWAQHGAPDASQDIIATLEAAGDYRTLLGALQDAGLTETLQNEGPYTLFAPTDDAFAALQVDTLSTEALTSILQYHVVPAALTAEHAATQRRAETLNGAPLALSDGVGGLMVNVAAVLEADLQASNGIIHSIDTVLLPPSEGAEEF